MMSKSSFTCFYYVPTKTICRYTTWKAVQLTHLPLRHCMDGYAIGQATQHQTTKPPTKGVVLRRLMFEAEMNHGASSTNIAALTVTVRDDQLKSVWEYAGYEDIL